MLRQPTKSSIVITIDLMPVPGYWLKPADLLPVDVLVLRLVSVRDGRRDGDEPEPVYGRSDHRHARSRTRVPLRPRRNKARKPHPPTS
jgi:hypothetical protein